MTTQTDIKLVAHLMRRAAFGLPAHRLELLAEQSYEDLVEICSTLTARNALKKTYLSGATQSMLTKKIQRWPWLVGIFG